jgi:hypothetical protein
LTASTAAKPQNSAVLLDDDRIVVLKIRCPSDGVFYLDRLGHDVLAFGAEEGHLAPRDAENQGFATIFAQRPVQTLPTSPARCGA